MDRCRPVACGTSVAAVGDRHARPHTPVHALRQLLRGRRLWRAGSARVRVRVCVRRPLIDTPAARKRRRGRAAAERRRRPRTGDQTATAAASSPSLPCALHRRHTPSPHPARRPKPYGDRPSAVAVASRTHNRCRRVSAPALVHRRARARSPPFAGQHHRGTTSGRAGTSSQQPPPPSTNQR